MQSLDKQRLLGRVLQRTSDFEDALLYGLRLKMSAWPHCIEQLIMRHEPSGVFHQMVQDRKRLGRQQDALINSLISVPPQTLVDGVEPKWRKLLHNQIVPSYSLYFSSFLLTLCTPK